MVCIPTHSTETEKEEKRRKRKEEGGGRGICGILKEIEATSASLQQALSNPSLVSSRLVSSLQFKSLHKQPLWRSEEQKVSVLLPGVISEHEIAPLHIQPLLKHARTYDEATVSCTKRKIEFSVRRVAFISHRVDNPLHIRALRCD